MSDQGVNHTCSSLTGEDEVNMSNNGSLTSSSGSICCRDIQKSCIHWSKMKTIHSFVAAGLASTPQRCLLPPFFPLLYSCSLFEHCNQFHLHLFLPEGLLIENLIMATSKTQATEPPLMFKTSRPLSASSFSLPPISVFFKSFEVS